MGLLQLSTFYAEYEHHPAECGLLAAGALVYLLLKAWPKPSLAIFSGLGCFLVFVAFVFIYKKTVVSQRGNSVGTVNYCRVPQAVSEEDQTFLNDLFDAVPE